LTSFGILSRINLKKSIEIVAKNPPIRAILGNQLIILPLYASEQDIARIVLGDRHEFWPALARHLEHEGLPPRSHLVSGLRYLPKVLRFFDHRELGPSRGEAFGWVEDGEERWDP
jgi:hypothetical protein